MIGTSIMRRTLGAGSVACALAFLLLSNAAWAVTPVVKTVPWVASNPLIPHTTWSGKSIRLKGTSDVQGTNFQYAWDFGDGSPPAVGTVTNMYAVEASHAYTCSVGDIFTARLTITDTNTGDSAGQYYFVQCEPQELPAEVNVAIDEGLWYLHKTMRRYDVRGDWNAGVTGGSYFSNSAANINAFEVNGHLESGSPDNPYTETVARGLKRIFETLVTEPISNVTYPPPTGTVNPDSNGNGYGTRVNQSYYPYQGGMIMDAIVASGTPAAVTTSGQAPSGSNPGILGRTYADIIQDMVDSYAFGQYNANSLARGGWRYSWNTGPDNSACQWAAVGLLAAEGWATVPSWVKSENEVWLNYSQGANGSFGYTVANYFPWGPYALSPSGMVQLAMDGIGRGDNRWDLAETYMRDRFCNTGGAGSAVRDYYYGMFSLTKSMLLHDSNGDGVAEPIELMQSTTAGVSPIDWYAAELSQGDQCDGVARTLVNDQHASGYWYGHNYSSAQYTFETAWAIIMLNRTVFASGLPVAVAQAVPNPAVAGQIVNLDGSASFHQDASKSIISWEWDLDDDGQFDDATGATASTSYPAVDDYNVSLRVCDDGTPQECDETTIVVRVTTPPVAPTADADGPYVFCPQAQPWFLDGTGSVNPDEGLSEPGQPGDTIQTYAWELDGLDNDFDEAFGPQPDVTSFFQAQGVGSYLIQLRVTDTTATSFPSSGLGDLSDTDSTVVSVRAASDPACGCIDDLRARAKDGKIQLVWTDTGAVSYNVYRGTTAGGPYSKIANTTSTYSTYLDQGLTNGVTYYYVVREAALNGDELCQSNEANGTPFTIRRRR